MRAVSHRYKLTSATSVDGFHTRHFSSISDQGLLALMSLYAVMEATSILPNQVRTIVAPLLAKPAGGWRPIGLFSSCYRCWGKLRRPIAASWGASNWR
eukprot:2428940-Pyramimonas_sp.AAC.1